MSFEPHPETRRYAAAHNDVIELLHEALDRALAGETLALALVEVSPAGCVATAYSLGSAPTPIACLVLGTERVKLRLLEHGA